LYDKNKDYHDTKAWSEARENKRNELISKYTSDDGSIDMDSVIKGMKQWDKRNSRLVLKKEGEDILVYKQIDDDVYEITKEDKPIFELNGDGGATYEANEKRIRDMLNLFRGMTGEISLDFLPGSVKKMVRVLENENEAIRKQAFANDKTKRLKA
jgi:hypothetical protein